MEKDPYEAAVKVLSEVRRIKSGANASMKTPLRNLEITGAAKTLSALRCVLGDLLSVTNARTAVLNEEAMAEGRIKVQATLGS